jgi:hypothetical protein
MYHLKNEGAVLAGAASEAAKTASQTRFCSTR